MRISDRKMNRVDLGTVHADMQRKHDCRCLLAYEADQRLVLKLPSGRLDAFDVLHQSRLLPSSVQQHIYFVQKIK
jgi:hypothetical protein